MSHCNQGIVWEIARRRDKAKRQISNNFGSQIFHIQWTILLNLRLLGQILNFRQLSISETVPQFTIRQSLDVFDVKFDLAPLDVLQLNVRIDKDKRLRLWFFD